MQLVSFKFNVMPMHAPDKYKYRYDLQVSSRSSDIAVVIGNNDMISELEP